MSFNIYVDPPMNSGSTVANGHPTNPTIPNTRAPLKYIQNQQQQQHNLATPLAKPFNPSHPKSSTKLTPHMEAMMTSKINNKNKKHSRKLSGIFNPPNPPTPATPAATQKATPADNNATHRAQPQPQSIQHQQMTPQQFQPQHPNRQPQFQNPHHRPLPQRRQQPNPNNFHPHPQQHQSFYRHHAPQHPPPAHFLPPQMHPTFHQNLNQPIIIKLQSQPSNLSPFTKAYWSNNIRQNEEIKKSLEGVYEEIKNKYMPPTK
ncbi:hypothetical protein TrVE_jg1439 [Triparma verrucosa]|uniref:Uncharacterized protein n=1 Tax=Triparma verrucosa TaxID=1606542 RepID=A0A9W7CB37_9STRA|nr:hypothetical protein TrVE_jg1439 [Triparma verrucosa]